MSSIVTAVFKATIGLLVNKGRDKTADSLKDGDVADQKFRGLIVREIDDIKSKLDGLSKKDLLASISFFGEGIELLYEVFDKARPNSEDGEVTTQAACNEAACFSLVDGMRNLELIGLDDSAMRALSNAKKRFEDSRRKATEAFNNEALETSDRILAMVYRVMATILETVDNPADAVAPCRAFIEELNSLPVVQNSFDVQLEKSKSLRRWFGRDERRKIISSVCHVNRVIYDVTQMVCKDPWIWSAVNTREDKVDPLRDQRLTRVLRKQGMEHCFVTWSFGQEGKEGHKLKEPVGIAVISSGQFIIPDRDDRNLKMFDSNGKFIKHISLPNDDADTELDVLDVATDINDNIYVLVELKKPGNVPSESAAVFKFNSTADLSHTFSAKGGEWKWYRVTVTDSGKVLVLRNVNVVDVYETDGHFLRSFGEDTFKYAFNMAAANNGRVMVVDKDDSCVHIFSEDGDHLNKFKLQGSYRFPEIAFHRASEHVVVAYAEPGKECLHLELYTKDGEFVRSTQIHEDRIEYLRGMTATMEGGIAVVLRDSLNYKILVV